MTKQAFLKRPAREMAVLSCRAAVIQTTDGLMDSGKRLAAVGLSLTRDEFNGLLEKWPYANPPEFRPDGSVVVRYYGAALKITVH